MTPSGLKRVLRIRKNTASGLVEVFNDVPTLAGTALPARFRSFGSTTVEGTAGFAITGGMLPYGYLTAVLSSSLPTAVIAETTASPTLRQTGVASETTGTANMQTVVSDNSGQSVTINFTAEFTNVGTS